MRLILFVLFIFSFFVGRSQFPITQTLGSSSTQVYSKGGLGADSGFVFRVTYLDTTTANRGFIDNIPGITIKVGDNLYMRNSAASAWVLISGGGGGVTLYSGDGTIAGDRIVTGGGTNLFFNSLNEFRLNSDTSKFTALKTTFNGGVVGIGTTTPIQALDVHSSANNVMSISNTSSTASTFMLFQKADSTKWKIGNNYSAGASDFQIQDVANSITPITIKNGGNVGIGTTAPAAKLHVYKDALNFTKLGTGGEDSIYSDNGIIINSGTTNITLEANDNILLNPSGFGRIGVGVTTPLSSSALDITSTNRGLLIPRLTTTQRNAILYPATGLLIWNTTDSTLNQYRGLSGWSAVGGGGSISAPSGEIVYGTGSGTTSNSNLTYSSNTLFNRKFEATDTSDNGTPYAAFRINRNLGFGFNTSAHGFRDQTTFNRAANNAYCAFDGAATTNGAYDVNHSISFQARQTHSGTGRVTDLYGGATLMNVSAGNITRAYGWDAWDITKTGGTIDTSFGFHVRSLTAATNNYAFYSEGTTPSYFGGNIKTGGALLNIPNTSYTVQPTAAVTATSYAINLYSNTAVLNDTNGGAGVEIHADDGSATGGRVNYFAYGKSTDTRAGAHRFFTRSGANAALERFSIWSSGKVSVNAPSSNLSFIPTQLFYVKGSVGINKDSVAISSAATSHLLRLDTVSNTIVRDNTTYAPAASPTFTGTITTPFTAGSIPYIGTSGVLRQTNANLFYDSTNNRVGVGTNSPAYDLQVSKTNTGAGSWVNNRNLSASGYSSFSLGNNLGATRFTLYNFGNSYGSSGQYQANQNLLETNGSLYLTATDFRFYSGNVGIGTTAPTSALHTTSFATGYTASAVDITATSVHQVINLTATGKTVTLPTAVGITGRIYTIKLTAVGTGTVDANASETIDGALTYTLGSQYKYVSIQSDGANWIIIANN